MNTASASGGGGYQQSSKKGGIDIWEVRIGNTVIYSQ